MSKYPRTLHLPCSPGGTNDDKRLSSYDSLLNKEIIITEKLDGSNSCLTNENVFARSHSGSPTHKSFDHLKSLHSGIKFLIKPQEQIFGENLFAIHSIEYSSLPSYFLVFGIRENTNWLSWDEVNNRANELNLQLAPVLFKGTFKSAQELINKVTELTNQKSLYGKEREGIVMRLSESFSDESFPKSVAKWVRKDHVQTEDHWMFQEIKKNQLI